MKKKILFIMMLFITLSGSYKEEVKATNSLNTVIGSFTLTEKPEPPVFLILPPDEITIEEEKVTTITTLIGGSAPIKVDIRHNDESIIDKPEYTIIINKNIVTVVIRDTKAKHAGKYKIIATNEVGSASATCTLNVSKKDPIQD